VHVLDLDAERLGFIHAEARVGFDALEKLELLFGRRESALLQPVAARRKHAAVTSGGQVGLVIVLSHGNGRWQ